MHRLIQIIASLILPTLFIQAMSLEETVRYALHHATSIKQAREDRILGDLNRKASRVVAFGEINLVADYNRYNSARTLAPLTPSVMQSGTPIPETKNLFSLGMTYSVPLFTGFAQTRQIEISELAKRMTEARLRLSEEEVVYNVRSLYLTLLALQELRYAQKNRINALKTLERKIARDVRAGKKAPIDRLKAQAEIEGAIAQLASLSSTHRATRAALEALIGKDPGKLRRIPIHPKPARMRYETLQQILPSLRKVSLEDLELKKAEKAIEKSRSAKLPQVSLSVYFGENMGQDTTPNDLGWSQETIWQVGLHAQWNLIDFGKRNLEVQKAQIARMKASYKREQTLRDLRKRLKEGLARIDEAYARFRSSDAQLQLSKQSEKIEATRYESGVSTIDDLLLARSRTQLARAQTIESRYNYQKSLYYLDYLLERGATK